MCLWCVSCDWFSGYAEDIWNRRQEIYDALSGSQDFYLTLKQQASLYGLAATQVPLMHFCFLCLLYRLVLSGIFACVYYACFTILSCLSICSVYYV